MYVETIFCENMGPIEKAVIRAGFTPEGNPKPIVLVGKNGSGKSIMLSNVVDALHESGGQAFRDVTKKNGNGHKYFKIGHHSQITFGADHLMGYVSFSTGAKERLEYLYCQGMVTTDSARKTLTDAGVNDSELEVRGLGWNPKRW